MDIDLLQIVAVLITGIGIPLGVQLLKQFWPGAPGWLKTVGPIVLPGLLVSAGVFLSTWLGVPVSFQEWIDVILMTTTVGLGATTAFKFGKKDPQILGRK
jgi:hypothetical protein